MEQIKLGLRIASIVVVIIGYSAIWIHLINNHRKNENSELLWVLWKFIHAVVIVVAFLWAWSQEKIMLEDKENSNGEDI